MPKGQLLRTTFHKYRYNLDSSTQLRGLQRNVPTIEALICNSQNQYTQQGTMTKQIFYFNITLQEKLLCQHEIWWSTLQNNSCAAGGYLISIWRTSRSASYYLKFDIPIKWQVIVFTFQSKIHLHWSYQP